MHPPIRLVHPFPSALNASAVFAIALIAGGTVAVAAQLALGMLGIQFCIGAVNDLFDEQLDALGKPFKPLPAGQVTRPTAWVVAALAGGVGLLFAASVGPPALGTLVMAAAMLTAGLAYDAWLKPTAFGWICFAVALPILPIYAWYGAAGVLPPGWPVLVPVAALAGLGLQLANGLIDLETDAAAGTRTLAVMLGRRRSLVVAAVATLFVHVLAWLSVPGGASFVVPLLAGVAGALALGGIAASAQADVLLRQIGWTTQAVSIAILAVAWLIGAV